MADLTIAEVATDRGLIGGPFGSNLVSDDYTQSGVPVIRGTNMLGREIGGQFVYVSREKFNHDLSRNNAKPGDLVFTQRGTLGQVALVPEAPYAEYVISQSQMRLRVNPTVAHPKYVYYAASSPNFFRQIHDNAISTGVPHINLGILSRLTIPRRSLDEQIGIVDILSALDDKIAANDHTLRLCVELADSRFKHAVDRIQPSDKTFGDLAEVGGGGTPKTSVEEYWNGDILWATPTDVTGLAGPYLFSTSRMITQAGLDSCASALYPKGSILMTSRATIGAFAITQSPTAVNQGFIVVNAKDPRHQLWLFHEMRARVTEFVSHANGATFLELSRGRFKQFRVRTPDVELARRFSQEVETLHSLASQTISESEKIANVRDELLPLLMSGKIRVREAEEIVEGVV